MAKKESNSKSKIVEGKVQKGGDTGQPINPPPEDLRPKEPPPSGKQPPIIKINDKTLTGEEVRQIAELAKNKIKMIPKATPEEVKKALAESFVNYTTGKSTEVYEIPKEIGGLKKDKVVVLGYADSSRMLAPFGDPAFEIWGLNELYLMIPKADRWFEIHRKYWLKRSHRDAEHLKWLKEAKIPIYLPEKHKEIPQSLSYPLKEVLALFNVNWLNTYDPFRYFNNSISPMVALAIYEAVVKKTFKEIHIYGVDMALRKEYREQKPSCEYFIGFAMGLGLKVYIPSECDLLKTGALYGFEEVTDMEKKFRRKDEELKKKVQSAGMQEREVTLAKARLEGALQLNDYYIHNWVDK